MCALGETPPELSAEMVGDMDSAAPLFRQRRPRYGGFGAHLTGPTDNRDASPPYP